MPGIAIIGNVNADVLVSPVTRLPVPGGDLLVDDIGFRTAGAAGNASLALHTLGVEHQLVGVVGDDPFGRLMFEELEAKGLADHVAVIPGGHSGVSICLEAPQRERAFFTSHGVLANFSRSSIPVTVVDKAIVLLTGYFTLPGLRNGDATSLLRDVRAAGGRTMFDTGWCPDDWPASSITEVRDLLPLVDVFLPNDAEAAALTNGAPPETAARILARLSRGTVVVKIGKDGALASRSGASTVHVPAPEVSVQDTTGAGDSFDAGFAVALLQGADLRGCLELGVELASELVSRPSRDRYATPAVIACQPRGRVEV